MKIFNLFCRSQEFHTKLENGRQRLYRIAYSWCHDPHLADDLVQETLSKALKKSNQLRSIEAMDSWLFTILANCWRSYLRSKREMVDFDEERYAHDDSPEHLTHQMETVKTVQQAIARLSIGQRQVLTLVDLEGFSYAEVAEILELPIGTVMSRLCRARQTLKDRLLNCDEVQTRPEAMLVRVK